MTALPMPPDDMLASYGRSLYRLTPAQRRRRRKKLRWFYGLDQDQKDAMAAAWRAAGRVIR